MGPEPSTPAPDLAAETLAPLLGDRPVRAYPALVTTQADAMAWARDGAPHGALVVADYQAAPRGRGGLLWESRPGHGLGFSLVLRPALPTELEGWLYLPVLTALADVLAGADATAIHWPDEVHDDQRRLAGVGVHAEPGERDIAWAVLTVLVEAVRPPRGPLLAEVLHAIEGHLADEPEEVLAALEPRCATLGRRVRARLVPMGPSGVEVVGRAVGCRTDGSLAIETAPGRTVAVPPQSLGILEPADEGDDGGVDTGRTGGP